MSTTERYRTKCIVCGFGNCQAALLNCPRAMPLDLEPPCNGMTGAMLAARDVPNRLYGATITPEGDAI